MQGAKLQQNGKFNSAWNEEMKYKTKAGNSMLISSSQKLNIRNITFKVNKAKEIKQR